MDNPDISLIVTVTGITIAAIVGMTAGLKGNVTANKNAIVYVVTTVVTYVAMKYSGW